MTASSTPASTEFIDGLSASMAGVNPGEYVKNHEDILGTLDRVERIVDRAKVTSIGEYLQGMEIKGALSSLYCFAANRNDRNFDRVADLESRMGRKLRRFAVGYGRARGLAGAAIRYLYWRRHYPSVDDKRVLSDLHAGGFLHKGNHGYLVSGLNLAQGDNTFGISWKNEKKQWRLRNRVCVIQAFHLPPRYENLLRDMEASGVITVPPINEKIHRPTTVGDHKYAVVIKCSRKDREKIRRHYLSGAA